MRRIKLKIFSVAYSIQHLTQGNHQPYFYCNVPRSMKSWSNSAITTIMTCEIWNLNSWQGIWRFAEQVLPHQWWPRPGSRVAPEAGGLEVLHQVLINHLHRAPAQSCTKGPRYGSSCGAATEATVLSTYIPSCAPQRHINHLLSHVPSMQMDMWKKECSGRQLITSWGVHLHWLSLFRVVTAGVRLEELKQLWPPALWLPGNQLGQRLPHYLPMVKNGSIGLDIWKHVMW